jgi:hypothetical protein
MAYGMPTILKCRQGLFLEYEDISRFGFVMESKVEKSVAMVFQQRNQTGVNLTRAF